jgi:GH25 family lysozyme M1 (1,4-beta-N-acetylmuramidase)
MFQNISCHLTSEQKTSEHVCFWSEYSNGSLDTVEGKVVFQAVFATESFKI